jgi:hypothetical protein
MLNRVDFIPSDFEDIIQQKGYNLNWSKSVACPCIDPATSHAVPDCINCDGRGRYFYESENIKGIITRQNKELQIGETIGTLEPGDAFLTVSHDKFLSIYDHITNMDSTTVFTETIIHSDKSGDWLRYPSIGNVLAAFTQTDARGPVVVLKQNEDFTLSDSQIIWISVKKPNDQQGVSFRYMYNPVWQVTKTVNYVRDTQLVFGNPTDTPVKMPIRVQIQLEYLGTGILN